MLGLSGGYAPTGGSGWPAVLVVEPGQHLVVLCLIDAVADVAHKFFCEIGAVHAGADMHVKTAKAHFLEKMDLLGEPFRI